MKYILMLLMMASPLYAVNEDDKINQDSEIAALRQKFAEIKIENERLAKQQEITNLQELIAQEERKKQELLNSLSAPVEVLAPESAKDEEKNLGQIMERETKRVLKQAEGVAQSVGKEAERTGQRVGKEIKRFGKKLGF